LSNIIFDEKKYAVSLLENGFKKPMSFYDLMVLAKYYRYKGFGTRKVKQKLEDFCYEFYPEYNPVIYGKKINDVAKISKRKELATDIVVRITQQEIDNIRSINNYKYEKVLFVALAVCKYRRIASGKVDGKYYNNVKLSYILNLAKLHIKRADAIKMEHELYLAGMIEPILAKYSTGGDDFEILYADEDSDTWVEIVDFDDLIGYYPPYCQICGKNIERGYKRYLCDDHMTEKRKETLRLSQRKSRSRINSLDLGMSTV
jgi:hypothetical protein